MSQAGPVNILNGIDLKIGKGEAIGLVGPSGSGKSTMLMVMAGLERPTSGKVTVAGQELSRFDEDAAARFRRGNVGIVFQSFHLIPTMTALENVAVPLELAMVANAFDRALEELKAVGLAHRVDHYPSQLSGGEQQRVALARAIAPRPGILFADEPTGNLDGRTGGEIMDLMFALQRERDATLVLVTHDEDLVKRCDRIVRLRDGRIDGIETIEHSAAPIAVSARRPDETESGFAAETVAFAVAVEWAAPPPAGPAAQPEAQAVAPTPSLDAMENPEPSAVQSPPEPVAESIATEPASAPVAASPPEPVAEAPAPLAPEAPAVPDVVQSETVIAVEPALVEPQAFKAEPSDPAEPSVAEPVQPSADAVAREPETEAAVEPEFRRVAAGGE